MLRFSRRFLGSEIDRSLAAGSASALAIRVIGVAVLLGLQLLLTRTLGPEVFGDYIYALNWINLLAAAAVCGMDTASLRFVASYVGTGSWGLLRGFVRRSTQIAVLTSLVLAIAFSVVLFVLRARLSEDLSSTLGVSILLLPVSAVLLLLGAQLRGFKQVALAMAPPFVFRPVLLGLGVLVFSALVKERPTAAEVMSLDVLVAFALMAAMFQVLRKRAPEKRPAEGYRFDTAIWLTTALPLLMITGVRAAMSKVDILMLGFFRGTTDAGVYAIAVQLAMLISLGLFAVNMILAPLIAQLYAQRRFADLQRIVRRSAQLSFVFSTLAGGFLLLLGKPILHLFGPAFVEAYRPLCVLVLGQVVNSFAGSVGFVMTMTKHEREAAVVAGLAGILSAGLALVLIPRFGLVGAAWATVSAGIAWNLVLVVLVGRRVAINPTAFPLVIR